MSAESEGQVVAQWPQVGLEVREHPLGLLVQQRGEGYVALNWRMSPEVHSFINEAISNGLGTVIRTEHPKSNNRARGVKYIAFSRTPYERWVAVLDQYSPANGRGDVEIRQFTVEQSYRFALDAAGVPYRQERGGGKNLYVDVQHYREALAAVAAQVDDVEDALGARDWMRVKDEIGFITEAVLETAILANWDSVPALAALELVGNQIDHMDIVARDCSTGALIVFELKRSLVGMEVLNQLRGYVEGAARRHANGKEVWGAILAREHTAELVEAIAKENYPIALFAFQEGSPVIQVETIASTWPAKRGDSFGV